MPPILSLHTQRCAYTTKKTNKLSILSSRIMALPSHLRTGLSPSEIEFISENELIYIVPHRNIEPLDLIQVNAYTT
jgi:hypothetical protein